MNVRQDNSCEEGTNLVDLDSHLGFVSQSSLTDYEYYFNKSSKKQQEIQLWRGYHKTITSHNLINQMQISHVEIITQLRLRFESNNLSSQNLWGADWAVAVIRPLQFLFPFLSLTRKGNIGNSASAIKLLQSLNAPSPLLFSQPTQTDPELRTAALSLSSRIPDLW